MLVAAFAARCLYWFFTVTLTLKWLGIEMSGLFTVWGLLGFGVTLTLQSIAKDMFSTFLLFMHRPFNLHEEVDFGAGKACAPATPTPGFHVPLSKTKVRVPCAAGAGRGH